MTPTGQVHFFISLDLLYFPFSPQSHVSALASLIMCPALMHAVDRLVSCQSLRNGTSTDIHRKRVAEEESTQASKVRLTTLVSDGRLTICLKAGQTLRRRRLGDWAARPRGVCGTWARAG